MPFIITENCTGCTACIRRCPTDAITGERKLLHVIDPELCINCGACGVVCPDEAIYDDAGDLCGVGIEEATLQVPSTGLKRSRAFIDIEKDLVSQPTGDETFTKFPLGFDASIKFVGIAGCSSLGALAGRVFGHLGLGHTGQPGLATRRFESSGRST